MCSDSSVMSAKPFGGGPGEPLKRCDFLTVREKQLIYFYCSIGKLEKAKNVLRNVFTFYKGSDKNKTRSIIALASELPKLLSTNSGDEDDLAFEAISNVWDAAHDAIMYGSSLYSCEDEQEALILKDEVMSEYSEFLECYIIRGNDLNFVRTV